MAQHVLNVKLVAVQIEFDGAPGVRGDALVEVIPIPDQSDRSLLHLAVLQHCLRRRSLFLLLLGIGITSWEGHRTCAAQRASSNYESGALEGLWAVTQQLVQHSRQRVKTAMNCSTSQCCCEFYDCGIPSVRSAGRKLLKNAGRPMNTSVISYLNDSEPASG